MTSSTPISRWLVTGLLALVLMFAYHVAIMTGLVPYGDGHATEAANYIRAERFAYHETPPEPYLLLVGSSMTFLLMPDYFSRPVVNLAMNAGNSSTGLELIGRTEWPRNAVVLVEMNGTIQRGVDRAMLDNLFKEPQFRIRHVLPEFREEYRPSAVLLKALRYWRLSRLSEEEQDRRQTFDPELRKRVIDEQVARASRGLGRGYEALLESAANKIEEQIMVLRQRGLRVVLFHIPCDVALETSLSVRQDREFFARRFPTDHFEWLPECRDVAWKTSDGTHLVKRHARIFARHMERHVIP